MDSEDLKILVIRFSSLGDLILMLPLLSRLRAIFPNSVIDLATKEEYSDLFEGNKNIDNLHTLNEGGFRQLFVLRKKIQQNKYDIILDAHNVIRSNFLYHTTRAKRKAQITKDHIKKLLLIKYKINLYKEAGTQVEKYLDLTNLFDASYGKGEENKFQLPREALDTADTIIKKADFGEKEIIAVAPGAKWDTKKWPEKKFRNLVSTLGRNNFNIVIVGGAEEKTLSNIIAETSQSPLINTTGELKIWETGAILKKCILLVTNDSALLHLSEYVGTPVAALFGPTVREFGYYPLLEESKAVEIDLDCRPCSRSGSNVCPIGTKECLKSISVDTVIKNIESILAEKIVIR
ncbi:MAG: glycosyltransferase family 9 protein [Candidatus Krumholzibacteriota bacterium]|nr:glycosyltransferase family 9 protein [Candidatus Krumholzibacteriota bacterium]